MQAGLWRKSNGVCSISPNGILQAPSRLVPSPSRDPERRQQVPGRLEIPLEHASVVECMDTGLATVPNLFLEHRTRWAIRRALLIPPPKLVLNQRGPPTCRSRILAAEVGLLRSAPKPFTRPFQLAALTTRRAPRRTPVLNVARCIGHGKGARRTQPRVLTLLLRPRPPLPMQGVPRGTSAGSTTPACPCHLDSLGRGASDHDTADQLRFLGSIVSDAWHADPVEDDRALALAKWAPGTVEVWIPLLRALSKTATKFPELSRADALSQHVRLMAAAGRKSVTLCGLLSAVRMCEKVGILPPTVRPIHWAMSAGADKLYQRPSPSPTWATPAMLHLMAQQLRDSWDFVTIGMAVLSVVLLLRVGEASSIRLSDLSTPRRIAFFHSKRANRRVTASLGAWGEAWRRELAATPVLQERSQYVPVAISSEALQLSMRRLLAGTGFQSAGWHAWRRMGAALLAWAGPAMWIIARWGRWLSERQAQYYSSPPLHWTVHFPIDLPWPTKSGTIEMRPTAAFQIWPENLLSLVAHPRQEPPIVLMDRDDSSEADSSGDRPPRDRVLGPARPSRGVRQRPARPSGRALASDRPHSEHAPPERKGKAVPRPSAPTVQAAAQTAVPDNATVGSQHYAGSRARASGRSRGPAGAHPAGAVRDVRRRLV